MKEISAGIIIYRRITRTRRPIGRASQVAWTHADPSRSQSGQTQTDTEPKFLILYHGRGYWNFPKGKVESEEKSWEAAVREIREETGFKLRDLRFKKKFKAYEKFFFHRQNQKIFKIVIFYLAETRKTDVKLSDEHEGYGWFTYKEAMRILGKYRDSQRVLGQTNDFIRERRKNA